MSRFTIVIDQSLCAGYSSCVLEAPDLFDLNDDGVAVARVADTDDARVHAAAAACPMGAITVIEQAAA
jgi:ferredoxin